MEKKVTIKENLLRVREVLVKSGETELVEFIDGRLDVLNSKSQNKKLTATQIENENLKKEILDLLAMEDKALTISEMQEKSETLGTLKNQKISALLKQLVDTGKVERIVEKKITMFKLIAE